MSESMLPGQCPLCGGPLTDIRGRAAVFSAAEGTEWGCWAALACGARGRYSGLGEPVAHEPDSARLDGMCGRLIDAMAATSDRGRVELLAGCLHSLRVDNLDIMPGGGDDRERYWAADHGLFEEGMGIAEGVLG